MKTKQEILDVIGKSLGWVDYPSDSIEQGTVWHMEPEKAPFGRILDKCAFDPFDDSSDCLFLSVAKVKPIQPTATLSETRKNFVMTIYYECLGDTK